MKRVRLLSLLVLLMTAATGAWGMQIYISYPSWPTGTNVNGDGNLVLEMEASDSFENMKAKIEDKSGLNPTYMKLYFNSVEMANNETLNAKGVTKNSVLTLVYTPYSVTMKDGVKDADKWTVSPNPAAAGQTVTIQYNGRLKVKGVKATSDAAPSVPDWALSGVFSVSDTKQVNFSKGNLQLVGENTLQFAENQWDYFGSNQSDNHRDLFCWGTGNNPNQTTGNSTFTDWGDNTYLQATLGKGWRTMTKDEFVYVFNTRASGSSVFGTANGRYTTATINTDGTGVKGIILFPDGITIEASEVTTAGAINGKGTMTQCTTAQWAALAEKGCVFLPAGGFILTGTGIGYGDIADYWSSTAANASKAYNLGLNLGVPGAVVNPAGTLAYNYGLSVRLVREVAAPTGNIVDLTTLTADYVAQNGETLTGTLTNNVKISIADGATVTLKDVTITNLGNGCNWAGINCPGDATLVLEGTNEVCAGRDGNGFINYPGIWIAPNKTLTIQGAGNLTAYSDGLYPVIPYSAGIGGGFSISCGNIVINSGTITATGGHDAAGIGGGGGTSSCGNITINGGTITATGGGNGAGIGGGYSNGACGNITISGGTVSATGGDSAAGIGGGSNYGVCGNITIANTVTKVTATKGEFASHSIGKGYGDNACGTVTIGCTLDTNGNPVGGTVYWQNNAAVGDGNTYLAQATIEYPAPAAKPAATVTTAPTGAAIVGVGKTTELVSGGVANGGTLMYAVTTTNTKPTSTAGFSDAVPTAQTITASGKVYVWYYAKADDSHSDSEIAATAIEVPVADIIWDVTNVSDLDVYGNDLSSYEKEGVTLSANAGEIYAEWNDSAAPEMVGIGFETYESGGFTFTAPTGKAFTKIEMKAQGPNGWIEPNLGTGWAFNPPTVTWTGSAASTVGLLTGDDMFFGDCISYIAFYLSE